MEGEGEGSKEDLVRGGCLCSAGGGELLQELVSYLYSLIRLCGSQRLEDVCRGTKDKQTPCARGTRC